MPGMQTTRTTHSADQTAALGAALGRLAWAGTTITLSGDLGAGKTVFAQGVARGLGVTGRVPSPTYVIVQTHETARLPLWHADWYRLADADELEHLGWDEIMAGEGVVIIEWSSRFPEALPVDRLDVTLADGASELERVVTLQATGPDHTRLLVALNG